MDFIVGFPRSERVNHAIWVLVCLTKYSLFISVKMNFRMHQYAELYIKEVVITWSAHFYSLK